jgi:hypothetical protein
VASEARDEAESFRAETQRLRRVLEEREENRQRADADAAALLADIGSTLEQV